MSNEPIDLPVDEYRVRCDHHRLWRLTKLPNGDHIAIVLLDGGAYIHQPYDSTLQIFSRGTHALDILPAPKPVEWMATYTDARGDINRTIWSRNRQYIEGCVNQYNAVLIETWARMSDGTLKRYYPETPKGGE